MGSFFVLKKEMEKKQEDKIFDESKHGYSLRVIPFPLALQSWQ
jgi:hypothetical protein